VRSGGSRRLGHELSLRREAGGWARSTTSAAAIELVEEYASREGKRIRRGNRLEDWACYRDWAEQAPIFFFGVDSVNGPLPSKLKPIMSTEVPGTMSN
jgi:hypothetical protein